MSHACMAAHGAKLKHALWAHAVWAEDDALVTCSRSKNHLFQQEIGPELLLQRHAEKILCSVELSLNPFQAHLPGYAHCSASWV